MTKGNPFVMAAVMAALAAVAAPGMTAETSKDKQGMATDAPKDQQGMAGERGKGAQSPSAQNGNGAQQGTAGKQGAQRAGTDRPVAAIVLVPIAVATTETFGDGCWVRLYDGQNFGGNELSLIGPIDMPNMRTAFGRDWSGEFDSVAVGPKANLTVYDNENYKQRVAKFKPGQRVPDLDEKMGFFQDINSLRIACAGGTPTAQQAEPKGAAAPAAGGAGQQPGAADRSGSKAK